MNIQDLRLQLLHIADGNVDRAKHMEAFVFSRDSREVSGVEEVMGEAIKNSLISSGSLSQGRNTEIDRPPVDPLTHWSEAQAPKTAQTPKGVRIQRQGATSAYKLPDELLKSVDNFLYSLERSLQKQ